MVAKTDFYWLLGVACGSIASFFWKWSASDLSGFYVFLENDRTDFRQIFSGIRRKHLYIICCEKRCTGPLNFMSKVGMLGVKNCR